MGIYFPKLRSKLLWFDALSHEESGYGHGFHFRSIFIEVNDQKQFVKIVPKKTVFHRFLVFFTAFSICSISQSK
jgi:hypothetical protein